MKIALGTEIDKVQIINRFPHTSQVIGNGGTLIIAKKGSEIIGFLWAFIRDIPNAGNVTEMFINVVEIFEDRHQGKGIGSLMVAKCIETAREYSCYQVRAYFDISNIPSNRLWIKNSFAISPIKLDNGSIPGAYVTYKL